MIFSNFYNFKFLLLIKVQNVKSVFIMNHKLHFGKNLDSLTRDQQRALVAFTGCKVNDISRRCPTSCHSRDPKFELSN